MATTYSDNINIELIGSGDQAGAWGDTTNQNWKRIEESVSSSTSISLTPLAPSGGIFTWTLSDTVDAYTAGTTTDPGSTGRAAFVDFTGDPEGNVTVNVRGPSSELPSRIFYARNSTSYSLIFDCGDGVDFTLLAGMTAVVYTDGALAGNALGNLQVDKLTSGTGSATGTVQSNGNQDLELKTGNSTTGSISIADGASGDITVATNTNGKIKLTCGSTTGGVLLMNDGYLNFNTNTGTSGYGIRDSSGTIQVKNESRTWNQVTGLGYDSGEQAVALSTTYTLPHGLGVHPKFMNVVLKAKVADPWSLGYADDEEINVTAAGYLAGGYISCSATSSHMYVVVSSQIYLPNKNNQSYTIISSSTATSLGTYFSYIARAWA